MKEVESLISEYYKNPHAFSGNLDHKCDEDIGSPWRNHILRDLEEFDTEFQPEKTKIIAEHLSNGTARIVPDNYGGFSIVPNK